MCVKQMILNFDLDLNSDIWHKILTIGAYSFMKIGKSRNYNERNELTNQRTNKHARSQYLPAEVINTLGERVKLHYSEVFSI